MIFIFQYNKWSDLHDPLKRNCAVSMVSGGRVRRRLLVNDVASTGVPFRSADPQQGFGKAMVLSGYGYLVTKGTQTILQIEASPLREIKGKRERVRI